jgi:hypothetical protein
MTPHSFCASLAYDGSNGSAFARLDTSKLTSTSACHHRSYLLLVLFPSKKKR